MKEFTSFRLYQTCYFEGDFAAFCDCYRNAHTQEERARFTLLLQTEPQATCRFELFQLQCFMHHGRSGHLKEVTPLLLCHFRIQEDFQASKYSEVWLIIIIRIQTNTKNSKL